ncbi:hypothetical protein DL762_001325 [Monosporascus cannonballus]|uniref:Uncharacterized protein n=1 Tax=Monosporascus cannonballus TaxID=155416 RepID=A0ABY0HH20_9PEZI|nr:hypothetical protein DL762_001325 [Monosporascus cannonballus]RYP00372.1 hypothetical protein DL763_000838 [Monosporascus cannonballus]
MRQLKTLATERLPHPAAALERIMEVMANGSERPVLSVYIFLAASNICYALRALITCISGFSEMLPANSPIRDQNGAASSAHARYRFYST